MYIQYNILHILCVCVGGGGCQRLHTQLYIYVYIQVLDSVCDYDYIEYVF